MPINFYIVETPNTNSKGEKIYYIGVGSSPETAMQITEQLGKTDLKLAYRLKLSNLATQIFNL